VAGSVVESGLAEGRGASFMRLDVNHSRDHGPDLLAKAQYNLLFLCHVTDAVSRSLALSMRSALGHCQGCWADQDSFDFQHVREYPLHPAVLCYEGNRALKDNRASIKSYVFDEQGLTEANENISLIYIDDGAKARS
jgi:hypothetical protein